VTPSNAATVGAELLTDLFSDFVDDNDAAEEADPERLMTARMQADGGEGGVCDSPSIGVERGWFTLVAAALWLENHSCPIAGVVGALDGTLIRILTPPRAVKIAFNTRKCFYGVTLMAVCDANKRFLWCRSGVPGGTADSRAFKDSR